MVKNIVYLLLLVCAFFIQGCSQGGSSVIVLLPDTDGSMGKVEVKNAKGSVLIENKYEKVSLHKRQKPESAGIMPEKQINEIFAVALGTQPVSPSRFFLNFYWDSDKLIPEAFSIFKKIVKNIRKRKSPQIQIRGHADRSGADNVNYRLSKKRAKKVKTMLKKKGVSPESIAISFHGEDELLIQTPDDTPKLLNRRVEVIVR